VAPLTDSKIIAAERAFTVMTSHATLSPSRSVVIERLWRSDLSSLRHTGSDLMAFIACYFLMLRVAEADSECRRKFRRARVTA